MTEAPPGADGPQLGGLVEGSGPDPDECRGPTDVGKMYHDEEQDIWYECVFDQRKAVYTWTILPPGD